MTFFRLTSLLMVLLTCSMATQAEGLAQLDDQSLATVSGRDGLAFNLKGFAASGPMTLTYSTSSGSDASSFWLGNFDISRSDDDAATFTDPYRVNIVSRPGLADAIVISNPLNVDGLIKWQFTADWGVATPDATFQGGAWVVKDMVFYGGDTTITTPAQAGVQGVAFGKSIRMDIGSLSLLPNGRSDDAGSMTIQGIHVGTPDGKPWAIADATTQPGIFNAVTTTNADGTTTSALHLGIDWSSSASGPSVGQLVIDNISFKGASGTVDLGRSSISGIQLQYLDIKFR